MKSTAPFFHLIFIFFPFFPLPTLSQPLDWDDRYLQRIPLTPETMAAVERPFAHLTRRMNARPQAYGNAILFPHFYQQLANCTTTGEDGEQHLWEACGELLTFIWDLDLMPGRYRRNFRARNDPFEVQWRHLNAHWLVYYRAHPGGQERKVEDRPVLVPRAVVPLIDDPLHIHLDIFPRGFAMASYSSLMDEFLRNQAVYATKEPRLQRKRIAFHHQTEHTTKRLLKLRAIFMLAVGENFDAPAEGNAAGAQVEQQQQLPPPPPPVEEAVVEEEEEEQQQQHNPHQNEALAAPVPDHLYNTSPFVPDMDDLMSVLDEHPFGGGGEDDGIENDDQEEDELNNWLGEFLEPGDLQMRSMGKKGGKNQFVKMASFLVANRGLVTSLITLGFIGALIAVIWTLYSVYGNNFSQQKEQDVATTSFTTMITNDGV